MCCNCVLLKWDTLGLDQNEWVIYQPRRVERIVFLVLWSE